MDGKGQRQKGEKERKLKQEGVPRRVQTPWKPDTKCGSKSETSIDLSYTLSIQCKNTKTDRLPDTPLASPPPLAPNTYTHTYTHTLSLSLASSLSLSLSHTHTLCLSLSRLLSLSLSLSLTHTHSLSLPQRPKWNLRLSIDQFNILACEPWRAMTTSRRREETPVLL